MDTIRPLATIAILAALGLFLAMKINQTPPAGAGGVSGDDWQQTDPRATEDAPTFDGMAPTEASAQAGGASPSDSGLVGFDGSLPSFGSASPKASTSAATSSAPGVSCVCDDGHNTMAPMPTLPGFLEEPAPAAAKTASTSPPPAQKAPPTASGKVPSLNTSTPDLMVPDMAATLPGAPTTTAPSAQASKTPAKLAAAGALGAAAAAVATARGDNRYAESESMPIDFSALDAMAPPATTKPQPAAPQASPAQEQATMPELPNLAGSSAPPAPSPAPSMSPYDQARPAIDAALAQGELARAHLLLSQWFDDPTLTPAQSAEIENLLGQLAGTVIYSGEHILEPAYTVKAGETLETIGQSYGVPWQLLAKINGVPSVNAVQPGQNIKVVRGPFQAIVDLDQQKLTLMIGGRYAGRFPVRLEGAASSGGDWAVEQKSELPAPASPYAAYEPVAPSTAGYKTVVLRQPGASAGPTVALTAAEAPPATHQGRIAVALRDLDDLYDILSVGSRVTIRR